MNLFKDLTALRAERAVLRALKSGRPRKFQPVLMGLYRKVAPAFYPHLETAISEALYRLQAMGLIKFTPSRKCQLLKLKK